MSFFYTMSSLIYFLVGVVLNITMFETYMEWNRKLISVYPYDKTKSNGSKDEGPAPFLPVTWLIWPFSLSVLAYISIREETERRLNKIIQKNKKEDY